MSTISKPCYIPTLDMDSRTVSSLEMRTEKSATASIQELEPMLCMSCYEKSSPVLSLTVRMSELMQPEFAESVKQVTQRHEYIPDSLQLQIPEFELSREGIKTLSEFRAQRVRLAAMNVITRCEDIEALSAKPIQTLKLAPEFAANLNRSEWLNKTLRGYQRLAQALGKHIVLTGVDTLRQYSTASQIGIRFIQGRYIGTAMDEHTVTALIKGQATADEMLFKQA